MRHFARTLALLAALPLVGTTGFVLIEGWNAMDAFYMAITTITTVGFREVHPLSRAGQLFVISYLIAGLGVFFYCVVQVGEFVVQAELTEWLGKRRMSSALKSINDHYLVCGAGRMGRSVCRHLASQRLPFVAIDRDEDALAFCVSQGWHYVEGDATDDRVLLEAGIDRARGLAAVLSSDADNLFVVLSSRLLAPKLQIISRAIDEKSATKMEAAGANRVISLFYTGAMKMAQLLVKPNLEDFFEIFTTEGGELDLAEIHVPADGPICGLTLGETKLGQQGILVVGIRRADGTLVLPPKRDDMIRADDRLIALGEASAVAAITET